MSFLMQRSWRRAVFGLRPRIRTSTTSVTYEGLIYPSAAHPSSGSIGHPSRHRTLARQKLPSTCSIRPPHNDQQRQLVRCPCTRSRRYRHCDFCIQCCNRGRHNRPFPGWRSPCCPTDLDPSSLASPCLQPRHSQCRKPPATRLQARGLVD
jgi:hypothetical protein